MLLWLGIPGGIPAPSQGRRGESQLVSHRRVTALPRERLPVSTEQKEECIFQS